MPPDVLVDSLPTRLHQAVERFNPAKLEIFYVIK